ncbi:MAG: aldehyde dehydrogenase family protein [Candidatus Eremiobacteraeota bacterium]|nr:aldehyde dehydrogenase family protein [Candidatus Eremiobacteraeota bacterium]
MYKLYINGAFVRSESGRSAPFGDDGSSANIAQASRKDIRDAVVAARAAQTKWWKTAPGTRGLILYRLAEMMESRSAEFITRVQDGSGVSEREAQREVAAAIDRTIWYAGWCDKYSALLSTRNPVGGPHFNFSTPEPTGVVGIVAPDQPALLGLVSVILPALVGGNAVVVIASQADPRSAITFAEALETSDFPAGVVNILTGNRDELAPVIAKHMDVNALAFIDIDSSSTTELQRLCAGNVKRSRPLPSRKSDDWYLPESQSLNAIADYCEIKTIWHPAGI